MIDKTILISEVQFIFIKPLMRRRHQSLDIFKDPESEWFRPDLLVAESEPSYLPNA